MGCFRGLNGPKLLRKLAAMAPTFVVTDRFQLVENLRVPL